MTNFYSKHLNTITTFKYVETYVKLLNLVLVWSPLKIKFLILPKWTSAVQGMVRGLLENQFFPAFSINSNSGLNWASPKC